jgi:DNA-binding XRE family transcriptional regulator
VHNLQKIRETLEVSQGWLADESGVSLDNIKDIESGKKVYKTNETIADALAGALGVQIKEIFREEETSIIGRTAHTGKRITHRAVTLPTVIHHSCMLETFTGTGLCTNCEQPLLTE